MNPQTDVVKGTIPYYRTTSHNTGGQQRLWYYDCYDSKKYGNDSWLLISGWKTNRIKFIDKLKSLRLLLSLITFQDMQACCCLFSSCWKNARVVAGILYYCAFYRENWDNGMAGPVSMNSGESWDEIRLFQPICTFSYFLDWTCDCSLSTSERSAEEELSGSSETADAVLWLLRELCWCSGTNTPWIDNYRSCRPALNLSSGSRELDLRWEIAYSRSL